MVIERRRADSRQGEHPQRKQQLNQRKPAKTDVGMGVAYQLFEKTGMQLQQTEVMTTLPTLKACRVSCPRLIYGNCREDAGECASCFVCFC